MRKRIEVSEEIREKAWKMYRKNIPIREIARRIGLPLHAAYLLTSLRKRGFETYTEYRSHFKKEKYEYDGGDWARRKGYESKSDYEEQRVKGQGFSSRYEYQKWLDERRMKRKENKDFSRKLKSSLEKSCKTQRWLAQETGLTDQRVSRYCRGASLPTNEETERIINALYKAGLEDF